MGMIAGGGAGVLLYMRQEGRGIGLLNKLRAYELQDQGMDTVEANVRAGLPARPARLRHRRPDPGRPGRAHDPAADQQPEEDRRPRAATGCRSIDRVPIEMDPVNDNVEYLRTKRDKMGHVLHHQDLRFEEGAEPPPQDGGGER